MNEADRKLVERVVKAAGEAGSQGFDHLVHYTLVAGIVDLFGYAAWIAVSVFLGRKLYAWKPNSDSCDGDMAHLFRGAGMLACAIFVVISIAGEANAIAHILAPAGAAIHQFVR